MLDIVSFILGPVQTNAYLVADTDSEAAVVIDPAWDGHIIVDEAIKRGWLIGQIWLTHAHFDHIGGIDTVVKGVIPAPQIALHPEDRPLWRMQGGASLFGMSVDVGSEPKRVLAHGQKLVLGNYKFEVRHTPGHTPGHVIFYCQEEAVVFGGDVVFWGSIGRADLPGGDYNTLMNSIRDQILTLPDETRLLTGHGPETTVGIERIDNPFLV
jgi:glyoxylase-like metal-dependent hydrolase (beta-lactamase superfamily II)